MRSLSLGLFAVAVALTPLGAAAQTYPDRAVTVIVPFPAGAAIDFLARTTSAYLSERLGKPFVVENKVGAGGNIGGAAVAKSTPNGYTLLFGTPSPIALNKFMYKGLSYDSEKDFTPVILMAKSPLIIAAKAGFPAKTFGELVAYAKANPGKVNVGNPGYGTLGHITAELVQQFAGAKMTNVPYRGSVPLTAELLAGQVDIAMDFMPTYVPHVNDKKISALAVTTSQRNKQLPNVPTIQEAGFAGFEATAWYAVVAPTGTPPAVIARLNKEMNDFLKTDKAKAALDQNSLEPVGGSPEDLKKFVDAELKKWKPVIEAAKITLE